MVNVRQIIRGYIQWVKFYVSRKYRMKIEKEAKRRIEICETCEYFNKDSRTCDVCGCFMDVKTKMDLILDKDGISIDGCWERKW